MKGQILGLLVATLVIASLALALWDQGRDRSKSWRETPPVRDILLWTILVAGLALVSWKTVAK